MRTILITMRYGFAARNVLRTDTFRSLRDAGHRIVLVCPAAHDQYLIDEVSGPRVILEPYPQIRSGMTERSFSAAANVLLFSHPGVTRSLTIKWMNMLAERRYLPFVGKGLASLLGLHRSKRLRWLAEEVDRKTFVHPEVRDLFDRYQPDLVVTTELFGSECHFVRAARQRAIPSVCLVKSWDNLTSKGRIRVHPDYLVVWSDLMKEEAVKLHFFPAERIFVSGAPNFDLFQKGMPSLRPRGEFLQSIGSCADSKLIVYSPGYKFTYSDDDNIRQIHRILRDGKIGMNCHLHVRKYPKSPQDFSHLLELPGITVEDAGSVVHSWDDRVDQSYEHMVHIGELMHHADMLIHLGSTIAVDAACFDTPIIGYFLDVDNPRLPKHHYARRVFDLTHNRYLSDLGGVRVVHTEGELVEALQNYLYNPEVDREGRRRIVDKICGRFDGRSGERIAGFLLGILPRGRIDLQGPAAFVFTGSTPVE